MKGRPRKPPSSDPRVERRRAQWRNYRARKAGRPQEGVPAAPDGRASNRPGRPRGTGGGPDVVRHAATGAYVRVTLP